MAQVMKGIKVLEVAQFVFVPCTGAVLAEWGADVIKVEHPVRGDAQRGMRSISGVTFDPVVNPMIQHPNKGKRSIGIDIATEEGRELARADIMSLLRAKIDVVIQFQVFERAGQDGRVQKVRRITEVYYDPAYKRKQLG